MNIFQSQNNSENSQFEFLDIITIISFIVQLSNIQGDEKFINYIEKLTHAIADEVDKIYVNLDIVIKQNEEILKILKGEKNEA